MNALQAQAMQHSRLMADPRDPVRDYLLGAFKQGVTDTMDPAALGALFRVSDPLDGRLRHEVLVEPEFLTSLTPAQMQKFLSQHGLLDALARAGTARVVVSATGLRIDAAARRRPTDGPSLR